MSLTALGKNVILPAEIAADQLGLLGGKGRRLYELARHGLPVPPWFAIPTRTFVMVFAAAGGPSIVRESLSHLDYADLPALEHAAWQLQCLLVEAARAVDWRDEVVATHNSLFGPFEHVAVRSSAAAEDGPTRSFAGQYESILGIKGSDGLPSAVERCWASAFSARALFYHHLNHLDPAQTALAVVVQRLVQAKASGVLFTVDPLDARGRTMLINAGLGLGTSTVSGTARADTYRIERASRTVAVATTRKEQLTVLGQGAGGGTCDVEAPPELQLAPAISTEQALALTEVGLLIERRLGGPQDVEWAIDEEGIQVLQARAITTLSDRNDGQHIVWDNANIVESYPGLTLPLTYTFARQAYAQVYRQVFATLGVPGSVLAANDDLFENMIGLIKGRVYYNLNNWYRALAFLPLFGLNRGFMERMMGVSRSLDYRSDRRAGAGGLMASLGLAGRGLHYLSGLGAGRRVRNFLRLVNQVCQPYESDDLRTQDLTALLDIYERLRRTLLANWRAPIINDLLTMVFYGLLRRLSSAYGLDREGENVDDLLCGEPGVLSAEPARQLALLAGMVRENAQLRHLFATSTDKELASLLATNGLPDPLKGAVSEYLDRCGYRCVQELKLEQPSLRQDPSPIFAAIRTYVEREDVDPASMEERQRDVRRRAEARVRDRLAARLPLLSPQYLAYRYVLVRARQHVRDRENLRYARARVFGIARLIFGLAGEILATGGHLDNAQDIFYLETDEVVGFVRGTGSCLDLRGLVNLRRRQYEAFARGEPPPDRFETRGAVWDDLAAGMPVSGGEVAPLSELRGIGCCSGTVRGRARLVTSPWSERLAKGEILVAQGTDAGWIALFPLAGGLLVERGSALSHSAIVARELGLPTIVAIQGLTKAVRSGQILEIDGARGLVRLLADGSAEDA